MSEIPGLPTENDDGDATYLAETLRHERIDLLLDDSQALDMVRTTIRRALWAAGVLVFSFLVLAVLPRSALGMSELVFVAVVALVVLLVRWNIFRRSTHNEPISEWSTLLVGKAAAADSVYSHIAGRLRDREMPIQSNTASRMTATRVMGNRLVLVDGYHHVYVSVFAYGTSLYLGWSMWRIRTGADLLHEYRVQSRGDRMDQVGRVLNLDRLKAMREAVHSVCREALHTAVADIRIAEDYGFPTGMPKLESLPTSVIPVPLR
ncbi:hypothetical protein [Actinokineospora diospyrosa]|uniref:DUF304 domain-containing protein n=1 Tax=Actinokineospora diospyrosa TaxID=103728 RepID=A0ABT1IIV7_9PSEU|nr:hypothetical protein [Actinokineospora diospyrosa]MCP2272590.1 hypothetical protein [Actinokineospora diospyrosa]